MYLYNFMGVTNQLITVGGHHLVWILSENFRLISKSHWLPIIFPIGMYINCNLGINPIFR